MAQNAAETEQKSNNLAICEVSLERCSTYYERLYEQTNVVELGRGTIPCHLTSHLGSTVLSTGCALHFSYFPHGFVTDSSHFTPLFSPDLHRPIPTNLRANQVPWSSKVKALYSAKCDHVTTIDNPKTIHNHNKL